MCLKKKGHILKILKKFAISHLLTNQNAHEYNIAFVNSEFIIFLDTVNVYCKLDYTSISHLSGHRTIIYRVYKKGRQI